MLVSYSKFKCLGYGPWSLNFQGYCTSKILHDILFIFEKNKYNIKMKYYKPRIATHSGLSTIGGCVGGCYSNHICQQQQLHLKSASKSEISNTPSVLKLSDKNVKYIEDLKKILGIVKQ